MLKEAMGEIIGSMVLGKANDPPVIVYAYFL